MGKVGVSTRCPRCESRRGVTAGEVGHTPAPGGCLPSREGVNSTLAFVLGQAVGVGLQDLAMVSV